MDFIFYFQNQSTLHNFERISMNLSIKFRLDKVQLWLNLEYINIPRYIDIHRFLNLPF